MTGPLVTIGVPVYGGEDALPALLDCLGSQTYQNLDVLISVDGADWASAEACAPYLDRDPRFRMEVQPSRLGWAGNTDWTMRQRRGDFYIYQQHDDLISPTYIADLVDAAARWPRAAVCFSRLQLTGRLEATVAPPSLLGDPTARVLRYLRRFDWVPFRGVIRASALERTSGLILSDFDPFDSYGTELRFLAELALVGEFRLVDGPTYFKSWHGGNLSAKRAAWSREHALTAHACLAAWMIEVIAPAAASAEECRELFTITLNRFVGTESLAEWIASLSGRLAGARHAARRGSGTDEEERGSGGGDHRRDPAGGLVACRAGVRRSADPGPAAAGRPVRSCPMLGDGMGGFDDRDASVNADFVPRVHCGRPPRTPDSPDIHACVSALEPCVADS